MNLLSLVALPEKMPLVNAECQDQNPDSNRSFPRHYFGGRLNNCSLCLCLWTNIGCQKATVADALCLHPRYRTLAGLYPSGQRLPLASSCADISRGQSPAAQTLRCEGCLLKHCPKLSLLLCPPWEVTEVDRAPLARALPSTQTRAGCPD